MSVFLYQDNYVTFVCKDFEELPDWRDAAAVIVEVLRNCSVKIYEPGQRIYLDRGKIKHYEPNKLLKEVL